MYNNLQLERLTNTKEVLVGNKSMTKSPLGVFDHYFCEYERHYRTTDRQGLMSLLFGQLSENRRLPGNRNPRTEGFASVAQVKEQ